LARALIVGCGCRGRSLGTRLREAGWQVRGTTRDARKAEELASTGLEGMVADPDRIGTILEEIEGVTLVFWLMGSAVGDENTVAALHGPRLERLLEEVVDTPVRGVVYESAGTVPGDVLQGGKAVLSAAQERWRIPAACVDAAPGDVREWLDAMVVAAERLTGTRRAG
jgi:nucleoside-diphosphate-sugar epimerase